MARLSEKTSGFRKQMLLLRTGFFFLLVTAASASQTVEVWRECLKRDFLVTVTMIHERVPNNTPHYYRFVSALLTHGLRELGYETTMLIVGFCGREETQGKWIPHFIVAVCDTQSHENVFLDPNFELFTFADERAKEVEHKLVLDGIKAYDFAPRTFDEKPFREKVEGGLGFSPEKAFRDACSTCGTGVSEMQWGNEQLNDLYQETRDHLSKWAAEPTSRQDEGYKSVSCTVSPVGAALRKYNAGGSPSSESAPPDVSDLSDERTDGTVKTTQECPQHEKTLLFLPERDAGKLGIKLKRENNEDDNSSFKSGIIVLVYPKGDDRAGQALGTNIQPGWRILKVNKKPYSYDKLKQLKLGDKKFSVTFRINPQCPVGHEPEKFEFGAQGDHSCDICRSCPSNTKMYGCQQCKLDLRVRVCENCYDHSSLQTVKLGLQTIKLGLTINKALKVTGVQSGSDSRQAAVRGVKVGWTVVAVCGIPVRGSYDKLSRLLRLSKRLRSGCGSITFATTADNSTPTVEIVE